MSRLTPFIAIAFAFAVFFLYIRPTFSGSIAQTRAQISSYNNALAAAARFQQKEAELTQQRAQIPADSLARLSEFLPDGVDNVQLILDLDALAARSGITLADFSTTGDTSGGSTAAISGPSNSAGAGTSASTIPALGGESAAGGSPTDTINLTFKATGTYPAFRSFLAGIENSLRQLDVTDVQLSESDTGVYTYAVTVRIYWLR